MRCYQQIVCNFEEKLEPEIIISRQFHLLNLVPNNVHPLLDLVLFCIVLSLQDYILQQQFFDEQDWQSMNCSCKRLNLFSLKLRNCLLVMKYVTINHFASCKIQQTTEIGRCYSKSLISIRNQEPIIDTRYSYNYACKVKNPKLSLRTLGL